MSNILEGAKYILGEAFSQAPQITDPATCLKLDQTARCAAAGTPKQDGRAPLSNKPTFK